MALEPLLGRGEACPAGHLCAEIYFAPFWVPRRRKKAIELGKERIDEASNASVPIARLGPVVRCQDSSNRERVYRLPVRDQLGIVIVRQGRGKVPVRKG